MPTHVLSYRAPLDLIFLFIDYFSLFSLTLWSLSDTIAIISSWACWFTITISFSFHHKQELSLSFIFATYDNFHAFLTHFLHLSLPCLLWQDNPVHRASGAQKSLPQWRILCCPQSMRQATYPFPSTIHAQKHSAILPAASKRQHPQCQCGLLNGHVPVVLKERHRAKKAQLPENIWKRTSTLSRTFISQQKMLVNDRRCTLRHPLGL